MLMQISVHIMHENLAVCKIMEGMRTAFAKSGTWSQPRHSQITPDMNDHGRHANNYYFILAGSFEEPSGKGACAIRFSISVSWYIFPNFVRVFFVHLCIVYAPPKKLARPLARNGMHLIGTKHKFPWLWGCWSHSASETISFCGKQTWIKPGYESLPYPPLPCS